MMHRRTLLAAATLVGCSKNPVRVPVPRPVESIPPIRAHVDRIFRTTVCLRPFRAAGPRIEPESLHGKTIIHHYGHGGSGWSLSWGSAQIAAELALKHAQGTRDIAVIGSGAIGLTTALTLQRQGVNVTIYAAERPPHVRSSRATGSWTPDSRIALSTHAPASFAATWERMCRHSYKSYEGYLGLAGNPVEWIDSYRLFDEPDTGSSSPTSLPFAHYRDRVADLGPRSQLLQPGQHPFPTQYVRIGSSLTFNIASFSHTLLTDFFVEGGKFVPRQFQQPADLSALPQSVIVNCTGYGARALFKDDSIVPVRGQIAWLVPQDDAHYSISHRGVHVVARRDGIVVQSMGVGEMQGYNDANETPDPAEATQAVNTIADLFAKMPRQYSKG
jgi:glycine/D-amino acid oxidase-like deaminating enzyme